MPNCHSVIHYQPFSFYSGTYKWAMQLQCLWLLLWGTHLVWQAKDSVMTTHQQLSLSSSLNALQSHLLRLGTRVHEIDSVEGEAIFNRMIVVPFSFMIQHLVYLQAAQCTNLVHLCEPFNFPIWDYLILLKIMQLLPIRCVSKWIQSSQLLVSATKFDWVRHLRKLT